jgi:hypothetical protein
MEETPEELDWVNARADCELETAFQKLSEAVEEDVDLFHARLKPPSPSAVVFQKRDDFLVFPVFSVFRRMPAGTLTVIFHQKTNQIEIEDSCGAQIRNATSLFTTNGRCKFLVGGEELEQWQLRRAALEAIFFRPTPR